MFVQRHPTQLTEAELLAECEILRQRRSGPGGQHRNKVSTAIILVHKPSGVRVEASERRSQSQNQAVAVRRLRIGLALSVRTATEQLRPEPSELWRSRVHHGQITISVEHDDFPRLLAEALDVLAATLYDPKEAASRLGCTSSQLTKFLKQESAAFQHLNAQRKQLNLKPLF